MKTGIELIAEERHRLCPRINRAERRKKGMR